MNGITQLEMQTPKRANSQTSDVKYDLQQTEDARAPMDPIAEDTDQVGYATWQAAQASGNEPVSYGGRPADVDSRGIKARAPPYRPLHPSDLYLYAVSSVHG